MDLINNKYIETFTEEKIAIIKFKEKIFEFIINLDASDTIIEFISKTQYDNNIKALLFVNEPGSIDDKEYDEFIKSILSDEYMI